MVETACAIRELAEQQCNEDPAPDSAPQRIPQCAEIDTREPGDDEPETEDRERRHDDVTPRDAVNCPTSGSSLAPSRSAISFRRSSKSTSSAASLCATTVSAPPVGCTALRSPTRPSRSLPSRSSPPVRRRLRSRSASATQPRLGASTPGPLDGAVVNSVTTTLPSSSTSRAVALSAPCATPAGVEADELAPRVGSQLLVLEVQQRRDTPRRSQHEHGVTAPSGGHGDDIGAPASASRGMS